MQTSEDQKRSELPTSDTARQQGSRSRVDSNGATQHSETSVPPHSRQSSAAGVRLATHSPMEVLEQKALTPETQAAPATHSKPTAVTSSAAPAVPSRKDSETTAPGGSRLTSTKPSDAMDIDGVETSNINAGQILHRKIPQVQSDDDRRPHPHQADFDPILIKTEDQQTNDNLVLHRAAGGDSNPAGKDPGHNGVSEEPESSESLQKTPGNLRSSKPPMNTLPPQPTAPSAAPETRELNVKIGVTAAHSTTQLPADDDSKPRNPSDQSSVSSQNHEENRRSSDGRSTRAVDDDWDPRYSRPPEIALRAREAMFRGARPPNRDDRPYDMYVPEIKCSQGDANVPPLEVVAVLALK